MKATKRSTNLTRRLPWWKLRREVIRLGGKAKELPVELVRKLYFRRWYDIVTARAIQRTHGALPFGAEVGIYLIFPTTGLLDSHLYALAEMRAQGIAPVVVSNLFLSESDRTRLLPEVAQLIERPNVGYDFGGYRDGVLCLADILKDLNRLWLLNDSVWFIPQRTSWFSDARALGKDFVAATSHFALPRVDLENFRSILWRHSDQHYNFHYASYALGFGQKILRDPIFLSYWRKLDIRNDKTRTVRRGEIGLSQLLMRHGFSHGATASVDKLDFQLEGLDNEALDQISKQLVISSDTKLEALKSQLASRPITTNADRQERIAFILTCVARQPSVYVLPGFNLQRGFQFLKKSPLWLGSGGCQPMLAIISGVDGFAGDMIKREAEDIIRKM